MMLTCDGDVMVTSGRMQWTCYSVSRAPTMISKLGNSFSRERRPPAMMQTVGREAPQAAATRSPFRRALRLLLLLLALAFAAIFLVPKLLHMLGPLGRLIRSWQRAAPVTVALTCMVVEAVMIMLMAPATPIELAIAYAYGMRFGFAIIYVGKVAGSIASYAIGSTLLRGCCEERMSVHPIWLAMSDGVQKEPYRIAFLLRLAYVPIALKNYGAALLPIPFAPFTCAPTHARPPRASTSRGPPLSPRCARRARSAPSQALDAHRRRVEHLRAHVRRSSRRRRRQAPPRPRRAALGPLVGRGHRVRVGGGRGGIHGERGAAGARARPGRSVTGVAGGQGADC